MENRTGYHISRRLMLGLLSTLAVPFQRSLVRAFGQAPEPAPIPPKIAGNRRWAKQPVVPNKIKDKIQPLEYSSQSLHPESLLGRRLDLNTQIGLLKAIDVDSYLLPYREGKRPFWPSGEYLGKFMQGFSRMYLYTGDPELLEKMQLITRTWVTSQRADGWIGTGKQWGPWDVWEHKYTLLGLLEHYELTGDQSALDAANKIGDLYVGEFGSGRRDLMRTGSWAMGSGSILEPMVYLYRFTGTKKYLNLCSEIIREMESSTGPKLIAILGHGSGSVYDIMDPVTKWHNGRKGYEMLACLIGLLRMYQLTGESDYLLPAQRAWRDIIENRLYITGTTTTHETFRPTGVLPGESADEVGEGCVSAHWVFLNRILLHISGDTKYADEIEKTLYNHLLASKRPSDGYQAYFTALNGNRPFELQDIWGGPPPCCLSSVTRSIARTLESMWGRLSDGGFALMLYNRGNASAMVETEHGSMPVSFDVETDFPSTGDVTVRVSPQKTSEFPVALRVPGWTKRFIAVANGDTKTGTPGQFLIITRRWQSNDEVRINMDMNDRLIGGEQSYPGYFAFQHGPQVLALDGRLSFAALGEVTVDSVRPVQLSPVPNALPSTWVGTQAYKSDNLQAEGKAILVPFSDTGQLDVAHTYRTWIKAKGPTS
jgi:DUF1680 family protein